MMPAVKAMLRQQTSIKAEGSEYQALMGDIVDAACTRLGVGR